MGQHIQLILLLAAIVGFSLLAPGRCEREAKQAFQGNDNITPSPLVGGNNGWRPVISPISVSPSLSPSYRYIGSDNSAINDYAKPPAKNTEDVYRDNRGYVNNKQYSYNSNADNIVKGKKKVAITPSIKTSYDSRPQQNINENRHKVEHFEIDDIITSSSVGDIRPIGDENIREYSHYTNVRETTSRPIKHPVIGKLQLHLDSAEKAKKREHVTAQSARVESFVTTPSSLLGSFSEFGHATMRSREPASSKQDVVIRTKKKDTPYQVTPANNEYSMHLVPPPRFPPSPARYPDMVKKPYLTYRFPKPDLSGDEQRHVYYVHPPPPHRPAFFPPPHTPRPNGPYYGPPSIPNFAGLHTPHHYPGTLNGGLFPGNEGIKFYQRPDGPKPQFVPHQPPTPTPTPTSQPLPVVSSHRPQSTVDESKKVNQAYERPDPPPFTNTVHQEEIVTGRPLTEVRGTEGATFTVGSSFLAGNKQENELRPHHITSQQFHGQAALSPFSTISPITFEQAFNTGRPNPALSSSAQDDNRLTRPYFSEDRPTSFQHIQTSGPISHKLPILHSQFHKEVEDVKIEGTTPHFLPTMHEEQSLTNELAFRKQPTPPTHFNEVHHVLSRPWSERFPPAEVSPLIDIDVQAHTHTTTSPSVVRQPSRRPSLHSHRRPQPTQESVVVQSEPTREYGENVYRESGSSTRRPALQEQETLEYSAPSRARPSEPRLPEVTTVYPYLQEQETFEQDTATRVRRPQGSRRPVTSTGAPLLQEQSSPVRGYSRDPVANTERPSLQEVEAGDHEDLSAGSRVRDAYESSTGSSLLEEAGITEEIIQQTTERPVQSDHRGRRPHPSRKPSRYRQNSQSQRVNEEKESWSQTTEKTHRRVHSRFTTADPETERKPLDDVNGQQKEVRPHQRRRRPQHTTEEAVTAPAQPEAVDDDHVNKEAYPSLNELFDTVPVLPEADSTRLTTTPRPARRRTPYISTRGHDRNQAQEEEEDDVKLPTLFDEITTLADAPEPLTGQPDAEEVPPSHKDSEYSVYEVNDESAYDSVPLGDPERTQEELLTTTSTTTESPVITTKPTSSRYKPRTRYGTNSTRPRFSVKDYKDRINRLPQTKADDATNTPAEPETPSRTRYQSKVRGSYKKTDDINKKEDDSSETDSPTRVKFANRVRGGPYHKPDVSRSEQSEAGSEPTTETIRNKFRPKFGSSRFRTTTTTTTTTSPSVEDGESATDKTEVKSSTGRVRMPTGKYFSRYRSTTEDNKDPIEEAASSIEISSTSKPVTRTKNIFSASKRRYPSRVKYGSHVGTSSTEQTEYDESITSRIEEILQKLNSSRTTESTSTFATTKQADRDATTLSLQDLFPGGFEETSKPADNEIKSPATRTFIFMPTMPTTREDDAEKPASTEASKTPEEKAVTDVSEKKTEAEEEISPSQRVADLTSSATSGGYFNVMSLVKRKPFQYSVTTEEHILPIEAFFSNKEYVKDSHSK